MGRLDGGSGSMHAASFMPPRVPQWPRIRMDWLPYNYQPCRLSRQCDQQRSGWSDLSLRKRHAEFAMWKAPSYPRPHLRKRHELCSAALSFFGR